MYAAVVVITCLIAVSFFSYMAAVVIGATQDATGPYLSSDRWSSEENFDLFVLAVNFVNATYTYFIALFIFGLLCYVYYYAQRRGREQ